MNKNIWKYIKAESFFKDYLPYINCHRHKIRGLNGRGNPVDFSEQEKKEIKTALKKLMKDIINYS
jgi:hypothetical protein